jgi:hypothetical protein
MGKANPFKAVGSAVSSVGKAFGSAVSGINKAVIQPVYNATLKQVPGVDNALKKIDDTVGKAIPGGWGTVAAIGASFIPGSSPLMMGLSKTQMATGLGALSGSGVLRKGNEFNLQGAILGGAMAYGGAKLSEGLQAAGQASANKAVESAVVEGGESALAGTGSAAAKGSSTLTPTANALQNVGRFDDGFMPPDVSSLYKPAAGQSFAPAAGSDYGLKNLTSSAGSLNPAATVPSGLGTSAAPGFLDSVASAGSGTLDNIAQAGKGIGNLAGFGADGTAAAARSALTNSFGMGSAAALTIGASGLAALEQQKSLLTQQLAEGKIAQAEYDAAVAEVDRSIEVARQAVADNPFKVDTDVTGSLSGSGKDKEQVYDTLYESSPAAKETLYSNVPDRASSSTMYANAPSPTSRSSVYAMGGEVYGAAGSPVGNLGLGSIGPNMGNPNMGYPDNAGTPYGYAGGGGILGPDDAYNASGPLDQGFHFAAGGGPRFLSGGGDGMSDSIKAKINGTQEARLADGEFVIPADVVSHLGNGSSKAGAKQLYKMMDKVRTARTGTKKQGKQINPNKYLTA